MKPKEESDYFSSSYLQVKPNFMFNSKSKQSSIFHFLSIYFYLILFLLIFLLSFFIFFHTKSSSPITTHHQRLKRQTSHAIDKHHNTDMLRQLLQRSTSSVLPDCTINMASDGIYQIPSDNSLSALIIRLVERTFQSELVEIKRTVDKIRMKFNQTASYFTDYSLDKIRDDFRTDLRMLLASRKYFNELDIRTLPNDNGGSDVLKYSRPTTELGYGLVNEDLTRQDTILQTFTMTNVRETLKYDSQRLLTNHLWWIGPVLCEKNPNETYLMANIHSLTNGYFLIAYFNISSVDINQCETSDVPFGGTHKCPLDMECIHQPGQGFTLGAYKCFCQGPYNNLSKTIEGQHLEWNETIQDNPLGQTGNTCKCNPQSCLVKYNRFLRTIIIIIQSAFIVFVAILAGIVFRKRKIKIIKHSMWILLELVLFGAALLYASVIVDSLGPYGIVCLIMPWLRELGFTIVYGTLILRIYKMLAEFQSRKAHCVQVKEKDILRILFFISISIMGYLLGWTFVNIDHANENLPLREYLLGHGSTFRNKRNFQTCRPRSWDYLAQIAEFIFLCVGIRFIYSTRTAPCEYHERKLITIVVVCEMLFSTLLHTIKDCLWASIDPDTFLILSFFRCHLTVTCMVLFIFCTKLCFMFRKATEEYTSRDRFRSLPDGVEPGDIVAKLQSNGDIEFGELNIRDMDPEEIRAELKRLYSSLHVLKTKTMRKDNPHLTKRHGQRRKNRRFSMQAFQRHGGTNSGGVGGAISNILSGGGDKHDHDPTKTPEDSTGSHNETTHFGGMSIYRTSIDDGEEMRGRAYSDVATASPAAGQRVTFK
ncbi:unnamed protein product [Adineta ricciae]|uniref:G-protein coupled receptors family 3 profile domain-containing protein n=1 Tax=Adineta ricciae TaxID=249248 RepID=A0A816AXR0_ADIRI|nr:unnamed protein product [Adineta ricciae]CAF1601145.1 unnamed protein product [Adineta ricciae]